MRDFIAVAIGGMLGSTARHAVSLSFQRLGLASTWPLATLTVNIVGCFAIGLLMAAARRWQWLDTPWELAVRVGFLGGLTTFSSFGLETVRLWQDGKAVTAVSVIAISLVLGLAAVVFGEQLFRWLVR
jgi:fluoride exporter